jgi:hypothetical protein
MVGPSLGVVIPSRIATVLGSLRVEFPSCTHSAEFTIYTYSRVLEYGKYPMFCYPN